MPGGGRGPASLAAAAAPRGGARTRAVLAAGTGALGLALPPGAEERLLSFLAELRRWNRAYNLVADAPDAAWAASHLLDSLSIAAPLRDLVPGGGDRDAPAARVLDLGTGAGLPGIPLAIALPELRFVLLDGNGKKVRFCRHAVAALGLANVEVAEGRAEGFAPCAPFDAAVVRAVGSLARIRALVRPCCRGPVLAMKGRHPARELAELDGAPFEVAPLRVPGLDAERHLVILR